MKNILFLAAMVALSSCQLLDVEVGNGKSINTVINVDISGSGSARLNGNARSLKSSTTGSGRVDSKNLTLGK